MSDSRLTRAAQEVVSSVQQDLGFPATFGMKIVYRPEWSPKYITSVGPDDRHFMIYRPGDRSGEHVVLVIDGRSQWVDWERTTP